MPFHTRLLGTDRLALYSFIHSLNTNSGTSVFEPVAVALAHKTKNRKSCVLTLRDSWTHMTRQAGEPAGVQLRQLGLKDHCYAQNSIAVTIDISPDFDAVDYGICKTLSDDPRDNFLKGICHYAPQLIPVKNHNMVATSEQCNTFAVAKLTRLPSFRVQLKCHADVVISPR